MMSEGKKMSSVETHGGKTHIPKRQNDGFVEVCYAGNNKNPGRKWLSSNHLAPIFGGTPRSGLEIFDDPNIRPLNMPADARCLKIPFRCANSCGEKVAVPVFVLDNKTLRVGLLINQGGELWSCVFVHHKPGYEGDYVFYEQEYICAYVQEQDEMNKFTKIANDNLQVSVGFGLLPEDYFPFLKKEMDWHMYWDFTDEVPTTFEDLFFMPPSDTRSRFTVPLTAGSRKNRRTLQNIESIKKQISAIDEEIRSLDHQKINLTARKKKLAGKVKIDAF